jgi:hypothetical protein
VFIFLVRSVWAETSLGRRGFGPKCLWAEVSDIRRFHPKYSNINFHWTPPKLANLSNTKVLWERGNLWIPVADQKENQRLLFNTESCDLNFMCILYKDNYLAKRGQDLVMTTFRWAVNSVPEWVAIPEFPLTFKSRASCHFKCVVVIFTPQTLITQSFCHRQHI